jgi:hypothetical protein
MSSDKESFEATHCLHGFIIMAVSFLLFACVVELSVLLA